MLLAVFGCFLIFGVVFPYCMVEFCSLFHLLESHSFHLAIGLCLLLVISSQSRIHLVYIISFFLECIISFRVYKLSLASQPLA